MTAEIPSTPSRPYGMRRDLATASWQNRSPSYWIGKRIKMTTRLLVRGGHFEYKYTVDARPRAKKNSWSGTADRIRKFSRHPIVQRSPARDPNIFRFQTLHQIRPRIKIQKMFTTQSLIPVPPSPPSPPVWQERETMKPTHNREKSHVKQNCDCFRPCFWLFEKRRVSFSCVEHKARRMKMTQQKMPLIQTPNKTLTILHWWYSSPGRHKITSVHQLQIHGTGGVVRYYQVDVTWLKGLP